MVVISKAQRCGLIIMIKLPKKLIIFAPKVIESLVSNPREKQQQWINSAILIMKTNARLN